MNIDDLTMEQLLELNQKWKLPASMVSLIKDV